MIIHSVIVHICCNISSLFPPHIHLFHFFLCPLIKPRFTKMLLGHTSVKDTCAFEFCFCGFVQFWDVFGGKFKFQANVATFVVVRHATLFFIKPLFVCLSVHHDYNCLAVVCCFCFMTLWFLVTRPLVHHTGEASSTIHTTSPSAYTDSNAEMHEHEHLMCPAAAEQIDRFRGREKNFNSPHLADVCKLNPK